MHPIYREQVTTPSVQESCEVTTQYSWGWGKETLLHTGSIKTHVWICMLFLLLTAICKQVWCWEPRGSEEQSTAARVKKTKIFKQQITGMAQCCSSNFHRVQERQENVLSQGTTSAPKNVGQESFIRAKRQTIETIILTNLCPLLQNWF